MPKATLQDKLFESGPELPEEMRYLPGLISAGEERALLDKLCALPFKEFEFQGFLGKRRTGSFGCHYDFNGGGLKQAGELPEFLFPLRKWGADFAGLNSSAFEHALVISPVPASDGIVTVRSSGT